MKTTHRFLRTVPGILAIAVLAAVAPVQAAVNVNINISPPPPRYEVVPQVRPGYIWAPGYWAYQNRNYVWMRGHQIAHRPGQRWVADHWETGNRYRAGYWEPERRDGRDRDHRDGGRGDDRNHRGNDKHEGRDGGFCPPGQAKKGNC